MTDFTGHLKVGLVVGGIGAGAVLFGGFPVTYAGGVFALILLTSILPDIDIHSSKPRQWLGILLLIAGIAVALRVGIDHPDVAMLIGDAVAAIVGFSRESAIALGRVLLIALGIGIALLVGHLLDEFTTHRGMTHSLGFGVAIGALLAGTLFFQGFPVEAVGLAGVASVVGVGTHVYIGD